MGHANTELAGFGPSGRRVPLVCLISSVYSLLQLYVVRRGWLLVQVAGGRGQSKMVEVVFLALDGGGIIEIRDVFFPSLFIPVQRGKEMGGKWDWEAAVVDSPGKAQSQKQRHKCLSGRPVKYR